jgi:NAD-dependent dihydropyrimidine dehydrogenase PreA subunit
MAKRTTVVISQGQSQNPAKRDLEETLVAELLMEPGIEVIVIPHLYDIKADGTGVLALQGISGPVVVLSWLYERAARWILDRHGVHGKTGISLLKPPEDDDEDDEELRQAKADAAAGDDKTRVIDQRTVPDRRIYCLDLRLHNSAAPFIREVKRIAEENRTQVVELMGWLGGTPKEEPLFRFVNPANTTALGPNADAPSTPSNAGTATGMLSPVAGQPLRIVEETDRRWYPVIDYSRCTNCMECIDFCLFGVYGVDKVDTILVEQPDNCRKGCPACSRVCPENAIIFPQHKTPAIAGAAAEAAGALKIDLSKLFGSPDSGLDALEIAARERDEQLVAVGREAVGMSQGIPRRQPESAAAAPKDELDSLIDALDDLNL